MSITFEGREILSYDEQLEVEREEKERRRDEEFAVLPPPVESEEWDFWDYAKDVGAAPFRGAEGFLHGIYGLGDMMLGDALPDWDTHHLGRSESFFGGLTEGMVNFGLGFFVPLGWIGRGAHIGQSLRGANGARMAVPGLSKLSVAAQGALKEGGKSKAAFATMLGRDAAAGAITDFAVFDGHERRLSNLIQSYPGLENPVTEFLAADEDDPQIIARLKGALEGLPLGIVFDGFMHALGLHKLVGRMKSDGKTPAEIDAALKEKTDNQLLRDAAVEQHTQAAKDLQDVTPPSERSPEAMFEKRDVGPTEIEGVFTEPQGDIWTGTLPDGSEVRVMRDNVVLKDGGKGTKKVWVDADTGEVLSRHADDSLAKVAGYLQRRNRLRDDEQALWKGRENLDPEVVPEGVPLADFESVQKSIDEITTRMNIGGQEVNPRTESLQDLVANGIEQNDINLAHIDATPAAIVRAVAQVYKDTSAKVRGTMSFEEMRQGAQDQLSDVLGDDARALQVIADEQIAQGEETIFNMMAWKTFLDHNAQEVANVGAKMLEATPEDLPNLIARFLAAEQRTAISYRAAKSLEATSGRMLRANAVPFTGYNRLADVIRTQDTKDALKRAKQITEMWEQNPGGVHDLLNKQRRSTLTDVTMEWWINAILSGGKTNAINALSGAAMIMWRPLERMMGSAATLNAPGIKDALVEYNTIFNHTRSAFAVGWQAARKNEPILNPKTKAGEFIEPTSQGYRKAITGEGILGAEASQRNPGWSAMFDAIGSFVRIPTAVLGGVDEVVKNITFHSEATSAMYRHHLDQGLRPDAAAAAATRSVSDLTWRHQALSEDVLGKKHLADIQARQPEQFPDLLSQGNEARRRATREWQSKEGSLERLVTEDSLRAADLNTFQESLRRDGPIDESITAKVSDIVAQHPSLRLFLTFIKTPYNILRWNKERTVDPALAAARIVASRQLRGALADGTGREFVQVKKIQNSLLRDMVGDIDLKGIDPESSQGKLMIDRRRREAMGRVATGIGLSSIFVTAAANGDITGRGPKDKEQRDLLASTGWQPYSIKLNGAYVDYRRLDPFATLLGTFADLYTAGRYSPVDEQWKLDDAMAAGVAAITANATNKTYMTGMKNLVNIMTGDDKTRRVMQGLLASIIPTGWSQMAKTVAGDDGAMKEVRGFTDAILNKLPYYGDTLDPVRNFMGEPVRKIRSLGEDTLGSVANLFIPIAYREVSDDLIGTELAVLDHAFTPPRTRPGGVDLLSFRNPKGQSAYDRMLQLRGEVTVGGRTLKIALRKLMRSSGYQKLDPSSTLELPSPRIAEVNKVIQRYGRKASKQMEREFPDVYQEVLRVRREFKARRRGYDFEALGR